MFDKQDGQHLERLLLINKMRNLANDISHDRPVLMAKIFVATTTQLFLTISLEELMSIYRFLYCLCIKNIFDHKKIKIFLKGIDW
jgi:hypothetical protein